MGPAKYFALISLAVVPFAAAQTISPTPIIVQAAKPVTATTTTMTTASQPAAATSMQDAIKALQEMKATNEETLNKQRAALEKLDEVEKAAQQLKIYTKRT